VTQDAALQQILLNLAAAYREIAEKLLSGSTMMAFAGLTSVDDIFPNTFGRSGEILLVDDEARGISERCSRLVRPVEEGRDENATLDLLLTDVVMPGSMGSIWPTWLAHAAHHFPSSM
jgi:hypothetical protein